MAELFAVAVQNFLQDASEDKQQDLKITTEDQETSSPQLQSAKTTSILDDAEKQAIVRKYFRLNDTERFLLEHKSAWFTDIGVLEGTLCVTENFLLFFQRLPEVLRAEGYVWHRKRGIWHKRQAYLWNGVLTLYKNSSSHKIKYKPAAVISLDDIHSVVTVGKSEIRREHGLQISTSKKHYYLAYDTQQEQKRWAEMLSRAQNPHSAPNYEIIIPIRYMERMNLSELPTLRMECVIIGTNDKKEFTFAGNNMQIVSNTIAKVSEQCAKAEDQYSDREDSIDISPEEIQRDIKEIPSNDPAAVEFRKRFHLTEKERLYGEYWCGLVNKFSLQGHLYISENFLCFYANYLVSIQSVLVPIRDIVTVEKTSFSTSFLAKGIRVVTKEQELRFSHIKNRSEVIHLIKRLVTLSHVTSYSLTGSLLLDNERILREEPLISISPQNITILIVGSRGDVQPFIALAQGLAKFNHKVTVATHEAHRKFVTDWGLPFYPLAGDPKQLMSLMVDNDMLSVGFFKEGLTNFTGFVGELLQSCWEACQANPTDVIISNPVAMAGPHIAEKLGIPLFHAFTMPWTRTAYFPHPMAVPAVPMSAAYNYSSYLAVEQGVTLPLRGQFNRFRKKVLGLPALEIGKMHNIAYDRHIPCMYGWSVSVLSKPPDWPEYISVCGYWFLDAPLNWSAPPELMEFLQRGGNKPLYIGFGSITVKNPDQLTEIILDALKKTGQRAIIVKGWGGVGGNREMVDDHALFLDNVPHDWLFPQMAAVIHHGGAGTVAAGLRAGVPTLVVPFFGDQYFWGQKVNELGVGPAPIPIKNLKEKLPSAIKLMVENNEMRAKAESIGKSIRSQDGVERAVEFFHEQLRKVVTAPNKHDAQIRLSFKQMNLSPKQL